MMGLRDNRWHFLIRPLTGLIIAGIIIGLAGFGVFYLPQVLNSGGSTWSKVRAGSVILHYSKKATYTNLHPEQRATEFNKMKRSIMNRLGLPANSLPEQLHIYLSPDLATLKQGILHRKADSPPPLATLDLLTGKEAKPSMIRLITSFGWGRPSSEILRSGLQYWLSGVGDRAHIESLAYGQRRLSLMEMVALDNSSQFPVSLLSRIYDTMASPHAPYSLSLSSFASLSSMEKTSFSYSGLVLTESNSFGGYLINRYGLEIYEKLWKSSYLSRGVERVLGCSLQTLHDRWLTYLEKRYSSSPDYHLLRGKFCLNRGNFNCAKKQLNFIDPDSKLSPTATLYKGIIDLFTGNTRQAANHLQSISPRELTPDKKNLLQTAQEILRYCRNGSTRTKGNLHFITSTQQKSSERLDQQIHEAIKVFQKARSFLPSTPPLSRRLVFLTEPAENWFKVQEQLPEWVILPENNHPLEEVSAQYITKTLTRTQPYSQLLIEGLATFLQMSRPFNEASQLLKNDNWAPLVALINISKQRRSKIEAAAFVGYLLTHYSGEQFLKVWKSTSPLGGDNSLMSSVQTVYGKSFNELEDALQSYLRSR